jgi:hypothetical protein
LITVGDTWSSLTPRRHGHATRAPNRSSAARADR